MQKYYMNTGQRNYNVETLHEHWTTKLHKMQKHYMNTEQRNYNVETLYEHWTKKELSEDSIPHWAA